MITVIIKTITKIIRGLPYAKHCAKFSTCIVLVKPLDNHMRYEP